MKIILGSASRWRRELLKQAGIEFTAMSADIDERQFKHEDPNQFVIEIAKAKARKLLPAINEPAILITTDQTIVCNGQYHNKPIDAEQAKLFLQRYGTHPAISYTAIVMTNTQTNQQYQDVDIAKVYFNPIPESIIQQAIEQGDIFHCAGAFQIEGDAVFQPYIERVEGSIDSVKGLPLDLVKRLLKLSLRT